MSKNDKRLYETDLYEPVKQHFSNLGYDVYGEVNHCDLVALKEDELVIVELKLRANMELLIQAAVRQRLTNLVYVAIPKPKFSRRSMKWKDLCYIFRRLELGLIVVSSIKEETKIEIIQEPAPFDRDKSMMLSKKKREAMLKEIKGRTGDFNIGGSSQTKIMSAYKETCIHVACCLAQFGPLTPKDLREMNTGERTTRILYENHYEWFERVARGLYMLSDKGKEDLLNYPDLVAHYSNLIKEVKD
ncbi:DUF2161 domain-containing phosphodiesterase [Sporosarcina sp. CAU 1771]